MNLSKQKAIYYFQSYKAYFWQWEVDYMFDNVSVEEMDDFHVGMNCIEVPRGVTIAYKEQIEEVLKAISVNDLPPFGSLILAFLATNSGEVSKTINELFEDIQKTYEDGLLFKHVYFNNAKSFLETLIALPKPYKKDKNRIDLFAFIFKEVKHSLPKKYADAVLTCIQDKNYELNRCDQQVEITMSTLSKDFNALAALHQRYPTVNTLLKAWGKELPVDIDPEDTEIETISENPDLIQELIEDPKTFFMGSLIKRIWSGIQLPMHYAHPGEMPLGGISDITNKGKFDNLLISEFANDDLTFLHRIANKEALYIRRETTPEEDLRTRIFLIDTTIKNWGTPKILSFATAFALIHHPKNEMNFMSYAMGEKYTELVFDEKIDIIEGLQMTSPLLDASSAILQFIEACEEENIEITLFTSPKTLLHATMQRVFNLYHDKFGGIITGDTAGNIDVYKLKNGARRLVKHIQLPLTELWANSSNRNQSKGKVYEEKGINYPILYGYSIRNIAVFSDENYTYFLQKRGDLFRSYGNNKGYTMIGTNIDFIKGISQKKLAVFYKGNFMILYWSGRHHMIFKTSSTTTVFEEDLSRFNKVLYKNLFVHEEEIYLVTRESYNKLPVFTRFDIDTQYYEEIEEPSESLQLSFERHSSQYVDYFEGSVLSKIDNIIIRKNLDIIFNQKHRLVITQNTIYFELIDKKETYLDNEPKTYTEKQSNSSLVASFADGSEIIIDKNGVIIFKSKNASIPTFYLSSYIGIELTLATETAFAGNTYFYPDTLEAAKIRADEFERKYLAPFLQNILNAEGWS